MHYFPGMAILLHNLKVSNKMAAISMETDAFLQNARVLYISLYVSKYAVAVAPLQTSQTSTLLPRASPVQEHCLPSTSWSGKKYVLWRTILFTIVFSTILGKDWDLNSFIYDPIHPDIGLSTEWTLGSTNITSDFFNILGPEVAANLRLLKNWKT